MSARSVDLAHLASTPATALTNLLERALADPRAPGRLNEDPGWRRRRLCREELSVDVATIHDHQAADTAIGQITADALHIDVRAGAQ